MDKKGVTYFGNCGNLLALRSRVSPISSEIAGGYLLKLYEWTSRSQIYSAGREWRSRQLPNITVTWLILSSVSYPRTTLSRYRIDRRHSEASRLTVQKCGIFYDTITCIITFYCLFTRHVTFIFTAGLVSRRLFAKSRKVILSRTVTHKLT